MKKSLIIAASIAALLTGCASGPKMGNIIPQAGGVYQVVTSGESKDEALKSALFSAESTCKERKMRHVVTSQKTAYKGMVSEDANRTINKAADIASTLSGGWIPTLSNDDDYQMTLGFTCES